MILFGSQALRLQGIEVAPSDYDLCSTVAEEQRFYEHLVTTLPKGDPVRTETRRGSYIWSGPDKATQLKFDCVTKPAYWWQKLHNLPHTDTSVLGFPMKMTSVRTQRCVYECLEGTKLWKTHYDEIIKRVDFYLKNHPEPKLPQHVLFVEQIRLEIMLLR